MATRMKPYSMESAAKLAADWAESYRQHILDCEAKQEEPMSFHQFVKQINKESK